MGIEALHFRPQHPLCYVMLLFNIVIYTIVKQFIKKFVDENISLMA